MSEKSSSPSPPRQRRWVRFTLLSVVAFLALSALLIVVLIHKQHKFRDKERRMQVEIEKRLASLRAAGAPLTDADLARLYPDPPPERDAKLRLAPALDRLVVPKNTDTLPLFGKAQFPHGSVSLDGPVRAEIQRLLETNHPALMTVEQADLSGAWFASGFSGSVTNWTGQSVPPVMRLAMLLCLDAALKAESQQGAEAARPMIRALQLGRAVRSPATVWYLVREVVNGSACTTLLRVLNRTELAEPDLGLLATELAEEPKDLKEVHANELAGVLRIIQPWRDMATQMVSNSWTPFDRLFATHVARSMYRDEEFLAYLEWEDGLFASFKLSSRQQLEWVATNKPPAKPKNPKDESMLATILLKPGFSLDVRVAQTLATLRLARTAVAIERWRLAHEGRLPDALADLVPAFLPTVPTDPFADQPVRYLKLPRGYVVYSVGSDFTDEGGKEAPDKPGKDEHFDIPFTVER